MEHVASSPASDAADASGHRARLVCWFIALALGLFMALTHREYMNPDGISYLDLGDAFWRRDWPRAINGYWSPLYGWLLGLVLNLLHVSPRAEFLTVHLVNFAIYGLSLLSFDFFLRTLTAYHHANARRDGSLFATLPAWLGYALGFVLFIWSSLDLITVFVVTPDLLNSAIVYLACGLLVKIRMNSGGLRTFGLLGAVLGLGYLTRASMFPLAFVFLVVALASTRGLRRGWAGFILGLVIFLLVATPFVVALSMKEGQPTLGSSAKLNYASEVNGASKVYWQGGPPGCGSPRHPARRIMDTPPVYEFGTPIVATYPLWFDPSYWNAGIVPCFDWRQQLTVLRASLHEILRDWFVRAGGLAVAVVAMSYWVYSIGYGHLLIKGLADNAFLLIVGCAGLSMYAWVLVEPRYIAVFVTLLWMGTLSAVWLPRLLHAVQMAKAVVIASIVVMTIVISEGFLSGVSTWARWQPPQGVNAEVAEGLRRMGIRPGDSVAVFGTPLREYYWARLARARIVAEIPSDALADFWAAPPPIKAKAIDALLSTGARGIVAGHIVGKDGLAGWKRIGATEFFLYPNPR